MHILLVNARKPFALDALSTATGGDFTLSVITEPPYAYRYETVDELRIVSSLYDLTEVRDAALSILKKTDVDAVIGPGESSVLSCGFIRSYFGLPGMPFDVANAFTNKLVMKRKLRSAGIPVARFAPLARLGDLATEADRLGWPAVVKPTFGAGGLSTHILRRAQDVDPVLSILESSAGSTLCPFMIERFVDMQAEYHCDGIVDDGVVRFTSVSKYYQPQLGATGDLSGSYVLPPTDPDREPIVRLHEATVNALGMTSGVTHFEAFKTDDGFVVGEIACRPGGGGIPQTVSLQYGVDLWQAFADTSLGRTPRCHPTPDPDIAAYCRLPVEEGTIAEISGPDFLDGMPGLAGVEMAAQSGDRITGPLHSSSTTGLAFFKVPDVGQLDDRLAWVASRFLLRMR